MTPRAWWLFALSSVIWGVPYVFIRIALDAGVPWLSTGGRVPFNQEIGK